MQTQAAQYLQEPVVAANLSQLPVANRPSQLWLENDVTTGDLLPGHVPQCKPSDSPALL